MEIVNASQGQVFEQRGKMVEWIKDYCKERGVILSTKTSKESRIVLKCDLGGEYKCKKVSTTNSSSRLTNCDYEIICSKKKGGY